MYQKWIHNIHKSHSLDRRMNVQKLRTIQIPPAAKLEWKKRIANFLISIKTNTNSHHGRQCIPHKELHPRTRSCGEESPARANNNTRVSLLLTPDHCALPSRAQCKSSKQLIIPFRGNGSSARARSAYRILGWFSFAAAPYTRPGGSKQLPASSVMHMPRESARSLFCFYSGARRNTRALASLFWRGARALARL